jgi:hypothetical protein
VRFLPLAYAVAVLAAWVNGLGLRWYAVGFQLLGDSPDAGDFRYAAGAALGTAVLLLVALLVGRAVGVWWWALVATAIGIGTQVALFASALNEAGQRGEASSVVERTLGGGFTAAYVAPGAWPLLVLLVVVAVRATWSRRRPAPRDR